MLRPIALAILSVLLLPGSARSTPVLPEGVAAARAESLRQLELRRAGPEGALHDVLDELRGEGPAAALHAAAVAGGIELSEPEGGAAGIESLTNAVRSAEILLRTEGVTDRAATTHAAFTLVTAIEHALPRLVAAPPHPGDAPCDVLDAGPVCVAGTGSSVHTADKALIVDLGGDDTYRNSAGGADPTGNGLPVSVVVDVAGNDTYDTAIPSPGGGRAVQGGAFEGGVGILVDASGRDTYRAVSTKPGVSALGQGFGSSGVGLLADLGGDDAYTLEERTPGVATSQTQRMPAAGQGFGELGGLGVILDPQGDDVAEVRSAPPDAPTPAVRHAGGFGAGEQGGVGLHADLGGDDRFLLEALDGTSDTSYGASVRGFGYGFEGQGIDVGGHGDAERIARVHNDVVGQPADNAALFALGAASLGGFGAIHDPGGSDRYVADFLTRSTSERAIGDGCGCKGSGASSAAGGGQSLAIAAGQQGIGIIEDLSGNDEYLLITHTVARSVFHDDRSEVPENFVAPAADATVSVAGGGFAPAGGQVVSHAIGISNGLGLLADGAGNDAYRVDLAVEAAAEVVGPHHFPSRPDAKEVSGPTATATGGELDVYMQGVGQLGGIGALEDAAGDDAYEIDLSMQMRSRAEDRRDAASASDYPVTATAKMTDGYHDIYGQGIGVIGGAGFVHDGVGDDLYRIEHTLGSQASAVAGRSDVATAAEAVTGQFARVEGMGAGALGAYGELSDEGGTDRYDCRARSSATVQDEVSDEGAQCQVLGGGAAFGYFSDIEGGAADLVFIDPPFPALGGTRGQGVWYGPGGAGVNA